MFIITRTEYLELLFVKKMSSYFVRRTDNISFGITAVLSRDSTTTTLSKLSSAIHRERVQNDVLIYSVMITKESSWIP